MRTKPLQQAEGMNPFEVILGLFLLPPTLLGLALRA